MFISLCVSRCEQQRTATQMKQPMQNWDRFVRHANRFTAEWRQHNGGQNPPLSRINEIARSYSVRDPLRLDTLNALSDGAQSRWLGAIETARRYVVGFAFAVWFAWQLANPFRKR
jgi:hypothetical protein